MAEVTDEELQLQVDRAAGRKGFAGKVADVFDPSTRKNAEAAKKELEERRKKRQAAPAAPAAPAKEFVFKKGGSVRGDGAAQRGKTRGRMV